MQAGVYNEQTGQFDTRDFTQEELAEAQRIDPKHFNKKILTELEELDRKSIRALREGNTARIEELEQQAVALRLQLKK
jgi:hypothetical protein